MKLFTVDPSLTCTGWCWAQVHGTTPGKFQVSHVGRVVTPKTGPLDERVETLLNALRDIWFDNGGMLADGGLVVVEIPNQRVWIRHAGGGYGLAVYGYTVGSVHAMFKGFVGADRVMAVDTNWMGSRSKEQLRAMALKRYPALAHVKDPGHDVSDAIALGIWWDQLGRRKWVPK